MNQDAVPEIRKERFEFQNDAGERLARLLEPPAGDIPRSIYKRDSTGQTNS